MPERINRVWNQARAWLMRRRLVLSAMISVLLAGLLALHQVSGGPLKNLNDIGGWNNRALFIAMTACVHAVLLLLCAAFSRTGFARTLLRQIIITAGFLIMLMAINQKAYYYVNVMQPVVRAMDEGGLAAGAALEKGFSAPALLLINLITRGPVYDMYLLKLFAIGCYLLLCVLLVRCADRRGLGIRSEVLLALCMILPQGFMNAACSALIEVAAVTALAAALVLAWDMDKPNMRISAVCFGLACALNGVCLAAVPVYVYSAGSRRVKRESCLIAAGVMAALCLPAIFAGVPAFKAFASLLSANLGIPAYASGAPGMVNLIPRALLEETAQYAPILRHVPQLDLETYAQPFYTHDHFTAVMRGFAWTGIAIYMGICALVYSRREKPGLECALILTLGALLSAPAVTSGAWIAADVLCLYALVAAPKLRLPACLVLFATMCSSSYPMTEEVMLPMIMAFVLCLMALCMLLGVIPTERERADG